jgi:CubicO group peptidase (beta-lactamase class C family)
MRSLMRILACGVLLVGMTAVAWTQDIGPQADAYLTAWANQGRFSGVVLIAKGDKVLLRKGYGNANYELNVANTPETVLRIGSITKSFTALSILQLEEKGLLNVSDPVAKYVPELPTAWSKITIHQLLCHKSGIPDFVNAEAYSDLADSLHVEKALKEYADKPLLTKPGEVLRYSNSGYILLGRVIEHVTGESYRDYLTANILKPAGMTHTAYDLAVDVVPNRASGYRFDGETVINAPHGDPSYPGSAGDLRSTVDDMYRFDRAIKSGMLFSNALTTKAWTPYGHMIAPPPLPIEADYGYGWMIGEDFGHKYVGHGGWVNGFVSQFTRYPDDDAVIIVLSNFETVTYVQISKDLSAILFGAKYQAPVARKIVHPSQETLARYVGDYLIGPTTLEITMRNGRLYAFVKGQPAPYGLIATSDTEFYLNDSPTDVRFIADANGAVNNIALKFGDTDLAAVRAPAQKPGN